jgi:hypothetical protein
LDRSVADIYAGDRHVRLELWGLPFSAGNRELDVDDQSF